jgi:hypothetical protein
MYGWCIAVGLAAAMLALPYARHRRRRAERVRLDCIRTAVDRSLSALETPDGTPALDSPDRGQALPRQPVPSGPRRRVVLSEPKALSATLSPGWRFQ